MKIIFISDTHHSIHKLEIPACDILIHCGDISAMGYEYEVIRFLEAFDKMPAKHKIFIAGNHDFLFESKPDQVQELLAQYPKVNYLENSSVEIQGLKIWGSPWTKWFHDWAFNFDIDPEIYKIEATHIWNSIPNDTDIIVTHGPPYGVLDRVNKPNKKEDPNVGDKFLLNRIKEIKPLIHAFGHIHEGYGHTKIPDTDVVAINAAVLDERYLYKGSFIEVETENKTIKDIKK